MSIELGYWNIRGLAEPIRMLLTHLEVPFQDTQYPSVLAADFQQSEWASVKETLGLDFPNLPYLFDGEVKLSENRAILKYICDKYRPEYLGVGVEEMARTEEISSLCHTLSSKLYGAIYNPDYHSLVSGVLTEVQSILTSIAKTLDRSKYLVGSQVTYVDFVFFELIQLINAMQPGFLTNLSASFLAYQARFRSLPHIVEFENRDSPRQPFCGLSATFNAAVL